MKHVTITDFLTEDEINIALQLFNDPKRSRPYAEVVCEQITRPNLERINKALGQENDPKYLAYMIEYVMTQVKP